MRPKDPGKTARMRRELREELKGKKTVVTIYIILRVLVILTMVAQFLNGNFENVFLCILTLVLFTLPTVIERRVRIDLPDTLEIIILLFIFSAEILGEIQAYYTYFHGWDTMLHTLNGFLCAAIGFSLVDLFNRNERFSLSLSPVFMTIVAFCFSMTIGVLWEFFECIMDSFFLLDMQKDTIVHDISTVMLDPTGGNKITAIRGITDVIVVAGGKEIPLGLGGYLDQLRPQAKAAGILLAVVMVTGLGIYSTYWLTSLDTQRSELRAEEALLAQVMPGAEISTETPYRAPNALSITAGYRENELLGYCVEVQTHGFSGPITMVVGVDLNGQVTGVAVTDHSESTGMGTMAMENAQLRKYVGMSGTIRTSGANSVDVVTGATATSEAITAGVNQALAIVANLETDGSVQYVDSDV